MIDIHSHLVFEVDDGPSSIDEAVKMVYEAEEAGVKIIFATPHYREFNVEVDRINENFQELANSTAGCGVTLLLGYEVLLNPCILKRVEDFRALSLGGSKYILVEFPSGSLPVYSHDLIYSLQVKGFIPILAHPERNINFLKDLSLLVDFARNGCMVQLDAASILGIYGEKTRSFARHLLTSGIVDFVASDAHNTSGYTDWHQKAYRTVTGWIGTDKADKLFCGAARMILESARENMMKAAGV